MSTEPLSALLNRIQEAKTLPPALPYQPSQNPLQALRNLLQNGDPSGMGVEKTPHGSGSDAVIARADAHDLVGDILLSTLSRTPLQGSARAEAARLIALTLKDHEDENLRRALLILLEGNT